MEAKRKIATLCMIYDHPRMLLGMKKLGFGAGRWNGFGGKVEDGESIEDAARREVLEEAGIEVHDMEKVGVMEFEFPHRNEVHEVHIFGASQFSGEPSESDEMKPQWFEVDELPFRDMWKSDMYWIPLFLKGRTFRGKSFKGRIIFDTEDGVIEHSVVEL